MNACGTTNRPRAPRAGVVRALRACRRLFFHGVLFALWAFLVAPGAHTLRHRLDHVHGADGRVHRIADHGGNAEATPRARAAALAAPEIRHGAGGALHFGVMLTAPAAFVLPPRLAPAEALAPPAIHAGRTIAAATAQDARGPPARA